MACCSKFSHMLILVYVFSFYDTMAHPIFRNANNVHKQETQIDCDEHQNCFKCPINEQCDITCDAINTCHHLTIFAQYSSSLILNTDPLFISSVTIYAPRDHDTHNRVQIYKLPHHQIINSQHYHEMNINIIPSTNTHLRRLLSASPTIAPTTSPTTENTNIKTGFIKLLDTATHLDVLWYIIGVLALTICCVSCFCVYYFCRTQKAAKKIKKLSIKKPKQMNAVHPEHNNLKSPTANTVATFSSSHPTMTPHMYSPHMYSSHMYSPHSDATVSYNQQHNLQHLQPQSAKSKSYHSPSSHMSPKMDHAFDQSDSADETKEPVLVNINTNTIRSMDVDDIQLSPNTSINIQSVQDSTQSNVSKEFDGFAMSHPIVATSYNTTRQNLNQSHGNDIMYDNRVQSSSVPFRNMNNNNNNNMWNNNASYPHRNTVAVMGNVAHSNNMHQVVYTNNVQQHQQPQRRAVNNHNMHNSMPRNMYQHAPGAPSASTTGYQHNAQNNHNDQGFRFQPQYQYQAQPQPQQRTQYNIKVIRPQMNNNVPPPPPPSQDTYLKPQHTGNKSELTHITSSTIASLNTADFEDDNTNSVSCTESKAFMERQVTNDTDRTRISYTTKHMEKQETFATNTVFGLDTDELEEKEVGDIESKDVDSVIFSIPLDVENEEEEGNYMRLQRNMTHVLNTKSMFALDNQPSPEHSPNNTMIINIDKNQMKSYGEDSHSAVL